MTEEAPRPDDRTFRNHITTILSNTIGTALVIVVVLFLGIARAGEGRFDLEIIISAAALIAASTFLYYFWWKRTLYTFTDNELHVRRDAFLFKWDKHIQYTRLASVGVRRDIFNRIFGTSTLLFNVNSGVNATSSEATLVLQKEVADRLRDELNRRIFAKETTVSEDLRVETLAKVTNGDVILHAMLAQPTWQAIFGFLMLVYAVICLFTESSGGFITALVLLLFSEVVPFVSVILKYYNYRIYRVGDTITVESGLITTNRSSFKVSKINSVRIRQPLMARVIGRACLEAEVLGLASDEDAKPVLCPLKRRADVVALMSTLVPEYVFEPKPAGQPRRALVPMLITDTVFALAMIAAGVLLVVFAETYLAGISETWQMIVKATEAIAAVGIPLLVYGHSGLAQRNCTLDMGKDTFLFVYGGYDICSEYMLYDKVQFVQVTEGLLQRRFGVGRCHVALLSSIGFRTVDSGLFEPEELTMVQDEVMARIRDGRYDYRRYL